MIKKKTFYGASISLPPSTFCGGEGHSKRKCLVNHTISSDGETIPIRHTYTLQEENHFPIIIPSQVKLNDETCFLAPIL